MNHIEIIQQLGQDDRKEVSTIFDAFIRGTIRNTFIDIMADEVSALWLHRQWPVSPIH